MIVVISPHIPARCCVIVMNYFVLCGVWMPATRMLATILLVGVLVVIRMLLFRVDISIRR